MAKKAPKKVSNNLDEVISQIQKEFGDGSIMKLGGNSVQQDLTAVSTGSFSLDMALGIGGLPRGRIVEVYGPESSGKTTPTLHIVANVQKAGGTAAFIDAEHAGIRYMRHRSVSTWTSFWCHSHHPVKKRCQSPTR